MRELRDRRRELLAAALAKSRLLSMSGARVRLGYTSGQGYARAQVARELEELRALFARALEGPAPVIQCEECEEEAPGFSLAREDAALEQARSESLTAEGREAPQVLAALRLLGGRIEQVRVLEPEPEELEQIGEALEGSLEPESDS